MKNFNGYSRYLTLFMAFLLSAWVAGCGGGGGGGRDPILGSGGATLAPIALTVTAVVPLANATGVPINTKIITAAFSKAMDPTTLNHSKLYAVMPCRNARNRSRGDLSGSRQCGNAYTSGSQSSDQHYMYSHGYHRGQGHDRDCTGQ